MLDYINRLLNKWKHQPFANYIYSIYIYIGENIELMDLSLLVLMGNHPYGFMENLVMGKSS